MRDLRPLAYNFKNKTNKLTRSNALLASDSDSIFRRTLLGYYADGMHANC